MATAILSDTIFDGERMRYRSAVVVADDRIIDIVPAEVGREATDIVELPPGALLAPGFVDLQVNGGGGVLFNDRPTVAGLLRIAQAHRRFGTTGLMPTLISESREAIRRAIDAVAAAIETGVPGILGIHLEGPFINPARKGAHPAEAIVAIAESDVDLICALGARGRTLVTLAPERVPPEIIAELARRGAIVSAGHTEATAADIEKASAAGLACVTHLFNAMSQLQSREPGTVGAALASERLFCGLIADGRHVADLSLRVAVKALGAERLCLVSDAMPSVGTDLKSFPLLGHTVYVRDGRLMLADGTLAGAHLSMIAAVRHMVERVGVSEAEALRMASATPARCLGLEAERGRIVPGQKVDLVALDRRRSVIATWIDGREEKA